MRVIKSALKLFGKIILILCIVIAAYYSFIYLTRNVKSEEVIVVEATFMQYMCGDENDDMKIQAVNPDTYKWLIGKDVDPQVFPLSKESELKGYFYEKRSESYGLTYRLTGRLSKYKAFGCDNNTPKFWVDEIDMIDGSKKMTSKDIAASATVK